MNAEVFTAPSTAMLPSSRPRRFEPLSPMKAVAGPGRVPRDARGRERGRGGGGGGRAGARWGGGGKGRETPSPPAPPPRGAAGPPPPGGGPRQRRSGRTTQWTRPTSYRQPDA